MLLPRLSTSKQSAAIVSNYADDVSAWVGGRVQSLPDATTWLDKMHITPTNSLARQATKKCDDMPFRVALVDDDKSVHVLMQNTFKQFARNWTLDIYTDVSLILQSVSLTRPRAVMVEIATPCISGIDFIRRVKTSFPDLIIIIFTDRADGGVVFNSMIAGASGYLIKPIPSLEIIQALRIALSGSPVFCRVAEKLFLNTLHSCGQNSRWFLTCREQEIAGYACRNQSDKEIAQKLGVSMGTVHTHLVNIFRKMRLRSRRELQHRLFSENHPE
jgi:DNA-binding NarL/FixJ family response regulator